MKRKGLSFYDSQHLQKMLVQQNDITAIFNRFIAAIFPLIFNNGQIRGKIVYG